MKTSPHIKSKHTIILVCGGSCSGKSVFAQLFKDAFVLEMDHFYFGKSQMKPEPDGSYNFDAPKAVDIAACAKAVQALSEGKPTTIPRYNMKTSEPSGTQTLQVPADKKFIVIEGIFSLYSPLRELGAMKIFLDTPTEIRVARRMIRDVEKGRSDIDTLAWSITVEKNHRLYVEPTKKHADLVIPFNYNPVQVAS
jgi:uridine kinase